MPNFTLLNMTNPGIRQGTTKVMEDDLTCGHQDYKVNSKEWLASHTQAAWSPTSATYQPQPSDERWPQVVCFYPGSTAVPLTSNNLKGRGRISQSINNGNQAGEQRYSMGQANPTQGSYSKHLDPICLLGPPGLRLPCRMTWRNPQVISTQNPHQQTPFQQQFSVSKKHRVCHLKESPWLASPGGRYPKAQCREIPSTLAISISRKQWIESPKSTKQTKIILQRIWKLNYHRSTPHKAGQDLYARTTLGIG